MFVKAIMVATLFGAGLMLGACSDRRSRGVETVTTPGLTWALTVGSSATTYTEPGTVATVTDGVGQPSTATFYLSTTGP
jgi:hypothetical protein